MSRIFVITASNPEAQRHVEKTIENPIPKDRVFKYFSEDKKQLLQEIYEENGFYAWGSTPGKRNIPNWESLEEGDHIVIYQNKKYTYCSKVIKKFRNKDFALNNWGKDSNGDTWEYMYFLEKPYKFDPPIPVSEKANYLNSMYRGFTKISDKKINRIKDMFGSIENFIKDYQSAEKKSFSDRKSKGIENMSETSKKIKKIHDYILSKGFKYSIKDIANFYLSLKTKPFVILAGISGTGKTQLAKLFAEAINATCQLIPVKPDWTDNSDLVGYVDLNNNFREKETISVIKKAIKNKNNIYFILLDEMNLARVEHYFSDFLSIIESRKFNQGEIITDRLIKEKNISEDLKNLYIPENIYILGTVNMDETTHPFSRKVLDRANSIELSDIDLNWSKKVELEASKLNNINNDFLKSDYINSKDLDKDDKKSLNNVLQKLIEINSILQSSDLQVGYRVRDEICFYMIYRRKIEDIISVDDALDYQIMQKILPRIQGSSTRIRKVLIDLLKKLAGKTDFNENYTIQEITDSLKNVKKYRKSIDKILFMLRRFDDDGFTSFWL